MRRQHLRFRPTASVRRAALGAALVVLAACSGSGKPIVVGAAGPWKEAYGAMNKMGIELAVAEINASGGIRGRRFEVVDRDDEGQGTRAAEIAGEFVANPDMVAVIGHVNSGAMVAAARVYDGELPAVATTATSPELTGISRWTFRVISSDSANGIALARFASTLGRRRAAIIYENNSYGRGLADAFQRAFAGEVISVDPIPEGDTDLEPFVSYYAREKADIVFSAGTDASGLALLREARRQHFDAAFLGGDGWTGLVSDTAASDGAYVGAPFSAQDPRSEAQTFVRAFRKKYGKIPDGNAALAYDATKLVAKAVAAVGPNRRRIRDWLAEIDERHAFVGVTGTIRFQPDGDPVGKSFVMTRVDKGLLEVASQ
ncbi:MAG TPA: ABC transporter substrate-binding protein [Gemmatimonadaceae bacterium]|nr:ABC transporter substrate-binding protein [Gemmatimonadaceae bacterium]